jgi:SHS2 domain-containing protein
VSHRFLDHTADVGVEITAASLDALFAEAAEALTETITDRAAVRAVLERRFELVARDLETLLVDWLNELVYVFEVDRQLFAGAAVTVSATAEGWQLVAVARGEAFDSARHPIAVLVKAVTHHGLEVVGQPGGTWSARVIFDI